MPRVGRKFILAVGFTLICCIFFAWGKLDQAGFIELCKWALTGYLGANVVQRAALAGADAVKSGIQAATSKLNET